MEHPVHWDLQESCSCRCLLCINGGFCKSSDQYEVFLLLWMSLSSSSSGWVFPPLPLDESFFLLLWVSISSSSSSSSQTLVSGLYTQSGPSSPRGHSLGGNPIMAFRAIPDEQGGSLPGHVTRSRPQLSRHRQIPPLRAECSDAIGRRRRQTRATSCIATREKPRLRVNERWSPDTESNARTRTHTSNRSFRSFWIPESRYRRWASPPADMSRKDYAAEKGNVGTFTIRATGRSEWVKLQVTEKLSGSF